MRYTKEERGLDEELGKMGCGCILFKRTSRISGNSIVLIQYCNKHKSAPYMYEALKVAKMRIHNEIRHHPDAGSYRQLLQEELRIIEKALDKAEGK